MVNFIRWTRVAAWVATLVLAVASWTPAEDMIRTGMGGLYEHAIAYFVTGTAFMWGYRDRSPWQFVVALSIYAAVLEVGQLAVPGRHAGLLDWAAGATGVLCAALLMVAWQARG